MEASTRRIVITLPPTTSDAKPTAGRAMTSSHHLYEVRLRKDHSGVNLISDALPFGKPWYGEPNAIGHAEFYSRIT